MAPKKMKGGDLTKEQQEMLANLATKGLTYAGKKFAKSDMGKELGGLASNLASSAFSSLFGNGTSGGAKGDQRRFMANRAVPNRVPNAVRVREMNDVKNYNRNQFQRVFDMEKRQVQGESESIKPIDAKDAGAAFKLQSYISKLQQILGQKADLFSQLQASPFTDLNQLKGTTKQAGLLTMIVSRAEFLQAYNEMVAYVALFFKDIQLDNRVRDRMYATYFAPLMDQMRQLGDQYPQLFKGIPAPERAEGRQPETRQGKVYDLVRTEIRNMYSLLNVAADNIQDGIFRPIGAKDVAEYSRDNDVNDIFAKNPPPPGPPVQSMASKQAEQQVRMADQVIAGNARAAQARAAEIAERNPYDPRGDIGLDPQTQAAYANIQNQVAELGQGPATTFPLRTIPELTAEFRAGRMSRDAISQYLVGMLQIGVVLGAFSQGQYLAAVQQAEVDEGPVNDLVDLAFPAIQIYNDWVVSRGVLAPGEGDVMPEPDVGGPPERREPERREPAPAQLPPAEDGDVDDAVRTFVQRSGYPADRKLPKQDSGTGEVGVSSGARWRPLQNIISIVRDAGSKTIPAQVIRAIDRYNATKEKQTPGKKKKKQQEQGQQAGPAPEDPAAPEEEEGEEQLGSGMSGGRFRSHQNLHGRSGRELDFVPAKALNSAAPPVSMGYGSHHRPKFAWEAEQEAAGPRYVRQDRQAYNRNGGLGMVNPDNEISTYHVLRTAGEVGRGMSGGVYLPKEYINQPAGEKEFFGYGVDGDNDVFGMEGGYGSLKRRLAMTNPFAVSKDYHYKPKESGYDDAMDFAYGNHEQPNEATQQAHEEEEEKPVDLDENPNPFRVRQENYKVNTGKMKKVSYKMPNM